MENIRKTDVGLQIWAAGLLNEYAAVFRLLPVSHVAALSKPPLFLFTHLPLTFRINAINTLINNSFVPF